MSSEPPPNPEVLSVEKIVSHAVREQLLVLDCNLRVLAASQSFYKAFQVAPADTVEKKLTDLGNGQWNIPVLLTSLSELSSELPETDGAFDDLEMEHVFPALGPRTMLVSARRLSDGHTPGPMILLSILDITRQKQAEAQAMMLANRYRTILASIGKAVIVADPESRVTFMNPVAEKLSGWNQNEALGKDLTEIFHIAIEGSSQTQEGLIARVIQGRAAVDLPDSTFLSVGESRECPIDGNVAPIIEAAGRLTGVVLVFHDVSDRREEEQNLEISEVRYRRLFESAHDGIMILDARTAK
ncbi:MAG: PAS domain S-box protein, partial [Bryobacteraceae bacterium]